MVARLHQPITFIGGKVSMGLNQDGDEDTEKEAPQVTEGADSDEMAGPSGSGRRARP